MCQVPSCIAKVMIAHNWKWQIGLAAALLTIAVTVCASTTQAQEVTRDDAVPERPKIIPNRRWEEDWSVLADPRVKREPLDRLKYIPLSRRHPKTYLSLGFNLRERFEVDHSPLFGTVSGLKGEWLLSRLEVHADLRLGKHVQVFAQLQSAFAPGKKVLAPVDQDRLDLEQCFIRLTERLGGGTVTLRVGRQLMDFDLQRFVSSREGPNLRQAFDAVYLDYRRDAWRITGAYTHPVRTRDLRSFDDYSSHHQTFSGLLFRRRLWQTSQLSVGYSRYTRDAAAFISVSGNERRANIDVRFTGTINGFDWDLEAMNQTGRIGAYAIKAWGFGTLIGHTFTETRWTPHLGLGVDAASGNRNANGHTLNTFNPLFPNGYYLADFTGYPNLIHIKPAITVHPTHAVNLMVALALQGRESIADAVYTFPSFPIANTAGRPGRYTGTYGELRADWKITPHYSAALEAVHYAIGKPIRQAGGRDGNYLGIEFRWAW